MYGMCVGLSRPIAEMSQYAVLVEGTEFGSDRC